jgi:hypothetical protein
MAEPLTPFGDSLDVESESFSRSEEKKANPSISAREEGPSWPWEEKCLGVRSEKESSTVTCTAFINRGMLPPAGAGGMVW